MIKTVINYFAKRNRQLRYIKIKHTISGTEVRSVICNNCVGAMVLNDFGLKFNSPFVNLFITAPDYIKVLKNIKYYCDPKASLINVTGDNSYPIGLLQGDITLHFLHYHSFEEAEKKWRSRCTRLDYENLYVILVQQSSCSYTELKEFESLEFENSIALVNRPLTGLKKSYVIKGWENDKTLGKITDYVDFFGKRYYDDFDWRSWLSI